MPLPEISWRCLHCGAYFSGENCPNGPHDGPILDQAERATMTIRALSEALRGTLRQIDVMLGLYEQDDSPVEGPTDAAEAALKMAGIYLADHGRDWPE